jgi:hypothetical protein
LLNAADPLDQVLVDFGFQPSFVPDPGGGHFGLQPQTAEELDPRGELQALWNRYLESFERLANLKEQHESDKDREALRRWRESR